MQFLKYSFLALLIIPIVSCQPDSSSKPKEKTKHVFAKFYVRYLQAEKELKAEATFKQGDSLSNARSIVLTEANFEKSEMKIQNLGKSHGIRYSFRKTAPYSTQYSFDFSNEQIGSHSHIVTMEPITEFSIKNNIIKKEEGMTLHWNGEPLNTKQQIVLLFTDEKNRAIPITISGPTDASEITLSPEKIENLSLGKGDLMVIKKQLVRSKESNFTKTTEMEFYSNNIDIEIGK